MSTTRASMQPLPAFRPQPTAPQAPGVAKEIRFGFGENWSRFLPSLDEPRVAAAEASLREMLERPDLSGLSFLDVGCGSGLFSLAARRLGASVRSFDVDLHSVACAERLRDTHRPGDPRWVIEQGSILDDRFVERLGSYDVVYAWGVLHHTGRMWDALHRATSLVRPGGNLFIAIYNDVGSRSRRWRRVKRAYNVLPRWLRPPLAAVTLVPDIAKSALRSVASLRLDDGLAVWLHGRRDRGMSPWRDHVDWVGGYPYEVASAGALFDFFRARGFRLQRLKSTSGLGCNELVLVREGSAVP